jgi:hypothetical protein
MLKLKEHLLSINNNSEDYFLEDCLKISKNNIEKKYDDYIQHSNIKVNVSNIIKNIYNTKKEDALEICKTTLNDDLSTIGY